MKRNNQLRNVARSSKPDAESASAPPPTVSPRWLMAAVIIAVLAAALCAWGTLCLLFWQGSWQLLYHPQANVTRDPSSAGVAFEPVGFAATETGKLQLQGWWIPASKSGPLSSYTILHLHGATGNIGNSAEDLARLHDVGVNVLAFDYRGYGQSLFAHPSEARWIEDTNWALDYLTKTRHIDPRSIVLAGKELGADLAVEVAAAHPELAGVIVESPVENPAGAIFNDPRAHLVPARLLAGDRYDLDEAAARLGIPSLWLLPSSATVNAGEPTAFGRVPAPRQLVRLAAGQDNGQKSADAISQWLANLPSR